MIGKTQMAGRFVSGGILVLAAIASGQTSSSVVRQYCSGCHNDKSKSGGMTLTKLDLENPQQNAELAEKVIRKVRAGLMPPAGAPRPDAATLRNFAAVLE